MAKLTNQQIVAERSFAAGAASRDAEIAELRQQVTLLREKFQELADNFVWNGDDHSYQRWVIEVSQAALADTNPKFQQSTSFTDPVTDDDFLRMIDE